MTSEQRMAVRIWMEETTRGCPSRTGSILSEVRRLDLIARSFQESPSLRAAYEDMARALRMLLDEYG